MSQKTPDSEQVDPGFGHGGVPWYLMLMYVAFLVFFTWYSLEYQLPDYLQKGPVKPAADASVAK